MSLALATHDDLAATGQVRSVGSNTLHCIATGIAEKELAAPCLERLFAPDIARSDPGVAPSRPHERLESWLGDKLVYFL